MSALPDLFDDARVIAVEEGEALFHRGDPVRSAFLAGTAAIALERPLKDGGHLRLALAEPNRLIAEASLFAEDYHCDAVARSHGVVRVLPRDMLLRRLEDAPATLMELLRAATRETQDLRARVEILRLRRLSDRLDAWLDLRGLPPPGGWKGVAEAIGVTPAALYRELAGRRD